MWGGSAGSSSLRAGVEDPGVGLREEDGDPPAVVGRLVVLAAGGAVDEAFAPRAAQVVGHLAL